MPAPTLRDVAQQAGVHPATASRALNPQTRPLVNADTARRVLRAAESLGYQPNPIARSLKTARTTTVGLVIPDLTNPLFPPIVRGIEDVLSPAGYSALSSTPTTTRPGRRRRSSRCAPGKSRGSSSPPPGASTRCWSGCTPRASGWCW